MIIHYINKNHRTFPNAICGAVGLSIIKTDNILYYTCKRCERTLKKKDVWNTIYGKIYFNANRQCKPVRTDRGGS